MFHQRYRCVIVVLGIIFFPVAEGYTANLDSLKTSVINADYKSAIKEGEKIIATAGKTKGLDEVYYFLALSYLKEGNYLRASDIFDIILHEYRGSAFTDEATLGLGDSYFLRNDYRRAEEIYTRLLKDGRDNFRATAYSRLSQCARRLGDEKKAREQLDALRRQYPLSIELPLCAVKEEPVAGFSVQVGSFSKSDNARNLTRELVRRGYPAYTEEAGLKGAMMYRVKVGKLATLKEAEALQAKLSKEGYQTKVCP